MYKKYDAYKDSGVQWLGNIPNDWGIKRLKFLSSIKTGDKNTEDKNDEGIYPFFVRSQIPEKINTYSFDGEAILTAGDGAGVGKVYHYINGKFDYHQRVYKFSNFKSVIGKFIYYYLLSNFYNVAILGTAKSTVDSLRLPLIQDFNITYPTDVLSQKKITDFLDTKIIQIDQAIAIKEQQIALLNERKQIVIQQAVTKGLDPNVKMKDSGVEWIGQIPEHWEVFANRAIFSERNESGRDGLPLLSVSIHTGVSDEEMDEDTNVQGRVKIEDKSKYILVKKGDIAFNMMRAWQGAIGAVSLDGMVSPAYIVAKPTERIDANFFEYQYRCPEFIQQMGRYSKGITDFRKRLYWDGFKQLSTIVPPISEQLKIIEFIKALNIQIETVVSVKTQQIQKLKEYKTTLINDAVTGKIKVA